MGTGLLRLPVAFATAAAMFFGSLLTALPVSAGSSNMQTLINQDRASNGGLAPLTWSDCLSAVAIQNVQRMVAQGYISHTNGVQLDLACGTGSSRSSGENVGYISSGIDDAYMNNLYMNSPGHRANILGAFQYVATAWAVAPNGYAYSAEEFLAASAPLVPGGYVPLPPTKRRWRRSLRLLQTQRSGGVAWSASKRSTTWSPCYDDYPTNDSDARAHRYPRKRLPEPL